MIQRSGERIIKVAVLGFESFAPLPIIGPIDILNESCTLQKKALGPRESRTTFDVELVSLSRKPLHFDGVVTLLPQTTISQIKRPDLILIPSSGPKILQLLEPLRAYIPWLQTCSAAGTRVVGMCTGVFLLAETGLLNRRTATTHWNFADLFRRKYPAVNLRPERLIVDEGNVITSGAATSFTDLALYLIELYCGHEAAVLTAKVLLLEMGRYTQLPYTIFSTQKTHDDREVLRIQQFMEHKFNEHLTIEFLARRAGMSGRNFSRRFQRATGELPSLYLQKLRIEKAKRLLESTDSSISDIMQKVGYSDERSFRRLFRSLTELPPKLYRKQYAMNALRAGH